MKCPDCFTELGKKTACPCGWAASTATTRDTRCEHEASHDRCLMQYDAVNRHGKRLCAWHKHCDMFGLSPTSHDQFMKFLAERQRPSAMQVKLETKGIHTPKGQWVGDSETLWRMVNGQHAHSLSAA